MPIERVGVVGAGTMGNGIAHVFARAGFNVRLCDVEQRFLDRGLDAIAKNHSLCGRSAGAPSGGGQCSPHQLVRRRSYVA